MASPLGSSEQSSLENIENQLEDYIKDAEKGKQDKGEVFKHIQDELKKLINNKNIPDGVKQSLQLVAMGLKTQKGQAPELDDVIQAKSQLDDILGMGKSNTDLS